MKELSECKNIKQGCLLYITFIFKISDNLNVYTINK